MKYKLALLTLLLLGLGLAFFAARPAVVHAQQPTPSDDEVNAIAHQLFCPVCENTPLDVCPTEACRQWRDLIRQMLTEGKSAREIEQYFVDNYGARVLAEPPRVGFNWLAYVVPPVIFLLGVVLLFRAFHLWKQNSLRAAQVEKEPQAALGKPAAKDEYLARMEEELRKRD
jgi:cytochrome c-type biogenesis protein CcmH